MFKKILSKIRCKLREEPEISEKELQKLLKQIECDPLQGLCAVRAKARKRWRRHRLKQMLELIIGPDPNAEPDEDEE